MHNFRVPPAQCWYTTPICTPDHGVLYIAGNHSCIGYIPAANNQTGRVQMIDLRAQCKAIVCDTTWNETRWFATLKHDNEVNVWDLNTATVVRGHRAHCDTRSGPSTSRQQQQSHDAAAMCITLNREILTITVNGFVKFCLRSNTYSMFRDDFVAKKRRCRVTALKSSPDSADIVGIGYNDGLVEIANIANATILRTFKGHNTSIVSMEWMQIHSSDITVESDSKIQRISTPETNSSSSNSNMSIDPSEHSSHENQPQNDTTSSEEQIEMDDINETKGSESTVSEEEIGKETGCGGLDMTTERIENEMVENATAVQECHVKQEPVENLADVPDATQTMKTVEEDDAKFYLATGAEEPRVYIWDIKNNIIAHTINLKTHKKSSIPKPICMLHWISSTELVIINPNGTINQWKLKKDAQRNNKFVEQSTQFGEKGIVGMCGSMNRVASTSSYWTFSIFHQIVSRLYHNGTTKITGNYGTLPIGMYSIRECPHDLNKIAIAGNNKRIGIVDTLTMSTNNIEMKWLTADIQGNVRALAWHPTKENVLSFSTDKSRIGTFDFTKPANPNYWFNGKQAYRIDYGISDDKCILYSYNDKGITMFSDSTIQNKGSNASNYDLKPYNVEISSLSICNEYLAIGTVDGVFKLMTLNFTELFEKKLSRKYISDIAWYNKTKRNLAVSNTLDGRIHLFECVKDDDTEVILVEERGTLNGHTQGVNWIKWNIDLPRLVSTGFDNTVRVWNTETAECLAVSAYNGKMYCAIFLPNDANLVACSGQSETLHVFDIREKRLAADNIEKKPKRNKSEVVWGIPMECEESVSESSQRKKQKVTDDNKEEDGPKEKVGNERFVEIKKSKSNTIFHISNREINRNAIGCLIGLLKKDKSHEEGEIDEDEMSYLISKITTKEDIRSVVGKEWENTRVSGSLDAIGNFLLPQITDNLKEEITVKFEAKLLTPLHVALSPSISLHFWRKCCLAYAFQILDKGTILEAMPYLLAIYQIGDAIDILCEHDYYREAWFIAKMHRYAGDEVTFKTIATKWINHLEYLGNFEGAALTAYLLDTPERALDILSKRKTSTSEIDEAMNLIRDLIASN